MRILITGITGRIGANLAASLLNEGHEVRGLVWPRDRRVEKLKHLDIELQEGSLTEVPDVLTAVDGVEAVYHLGAAFQGGGPFTADEYFNINVHGTFNMLEAAKANEQLRGFYFASTDAVLEKYTPDGMLEPIREDHIPRKPKGWYSLSKSVGEEMCGAYARAGWVPTTVLRFCYVVAGEEILDFGQFYLSRQKSRPELASLWDGDERVVLLRDKNGRPYKKHMADVRDIVLGLVSALDKTEAVGETFQLAGPKAFTWDEAVPHLSAVLDIPQIEALVQGPPTFYEHDISKAKVLLGFDPQYDIIRMIDDAVAFREGERRGVLPAEEAEPGIPSPLGGRLGSGTQPAEATSPTDRGQMVVGLLARGDIDKILERCRQLQVDRVTLAVGNMPGTRETGAPDLAAMREYHEKLSDKDITVSAWNQKGHLGRDPDIMLNPSAHRDRIDAALRTIEVQGELGIDVQLHYVGVPEPADPAQDEDYWGGLLSIFRELVAQAEASKVKIANHGIWRALSDDIRDEALASGLTGDGYRHYANPKFGGPFLVRSAEHIRRLIEEVPSDYNGVTMCAGMYIHGADPLDEIERFKGKIHFVQIRDLEGRWPHSREVFPGTGDLDFRAIIRALRDAGYDGFMHPEHLGQPRFPGEDLEQVATWLVKRWVDEALSRRA